MKKTTKKIVIGAAVAVALVVAFNLLPDGIRIASTISACVGFIAGVASKIWYDREKENE